MHFYRYRVRIGFRVMRRWDMRLHVTMLANYIQINQDITGSVHTILFGAFPVLAVKLPWELRLQPEVTPQRIPDGSRHNRLWSLKMTTVNRRSVVEYKILITTFNQIVLKKDQNVQTQKRHNCKRNLIKTSEELCRNLFYYIGKLNTCTREERDWQLSVCENISSISHHLFPLQYSQLSLHNRSPPQLFSAPNSGKRCHIGNFSCIPVSPA